MALAVEALQCQILALKVGLQQVQERNIRMLQLWVRKVKFQGTKKKNR